MRYFILNGRTAKRARFRDIAHEIQKTYDGNGSAESVFEKYISADLLSIEDVGTGKSIASEFDIETLLKLIDKRMEAKKTTIITSNKNMEGMADCFDTRIFSRLQTFLIIEMTGKDRRKE
jgi:DNA replication protein DnaC